MRLVGCQPMMRAGRRKLPPPEFLESPRAVRRRLEGAGWQLAGASEKVLKAQSDELQQALQGAEDSAMAAEPWLQKQRKTSTSSEAIFLKTSVACPRYQLDVGWWLAPVIITSTLIVHRSPSPSPFLGGG